MLTIPDVDAASHQFGMLAYGEIREKGLLGEPVTDDDIAAVVAPHRRGLPQRLRDERPPTPPVAVTRMLPLVEWVGTERRRDRQRRLNESSG